MLIDGRRGRLNKIDIVFLAMFSASERFAEPAKILRLIAAVPAIFEALLDLPSPLADKTHNEVHGNRQDNRMVIFRRHLNQAL